MRKKFTTTPAGKRGAKAAPTDELARLREQPDTEIDYSDIPETDAAFWAKAEIVQPATKEMISIRVDSDVLDWYRRHAPRYQSLINTVLRTYKEAHEK